MEVRLAISLSVISGESEPKAWMTAKPRARAVTKSRGLSRSRSGSEGMDYDFVKRMNFRTAKDFSLSSDRKSVLPNHAALLATPSTLFAKIWSAHSIREIGE